MSRPPRGWCRFTGWGMPVQYRPSASGACATALHIDERQRDSLVIRDDEIDIPPFLR
jgi:hypothetical protein